MQHEYFIITRMSILLSNYVTIISEIDDPNHVRCLNLITCPGVTKKCAARGTKTCPGVTKMCPDRGTKPGHLFVPRSGQIPFPDITPSPIHLTSSPPSKSSIPPFTSPIISADTPSATSSAFPFRITNDCGS